MNISRHIAAANAWLAINRPGARPITLNDVINRLKRRDMLSIEADSKTTKGSSNGYLTGILYLAPHKIVGFNLCPFAVTCIKDCLFNAGCGRFNDVTRARIIKTLAWLHDSETFKTRIAKDIESLQKKALKRGMRPVVRLNGTSDLLIEKIFAEILAQFPAVQFYDYTKNPNRKNLPANYHLTFSFDGQNHAAAERALANGVNVAAVFKKELPKSFLGFPVINGDSSDLRFLDPAGVVVGLIAKGSAKKSGSEFING